jgi:hypothetical protein
LSGWLTVENNSGFGGVGKLIWMHLHEVCVAGVVLLVVLFWARQDRAREESSLLPLSLPVQLVGTEALWIRGSQVVTLREAWVMFVGTLGRCVSGDTTSNRGAGPTKMLSALLWLELVHEQGAYSRHCTATEYTNREETDLIQGGRRREGRCEWR